NKNVRTFSNKGLSRESPDNVWLMKMVEETFSYLNISNINSVEVQKDGECGFACLTDPLCFSYNLEASVSKTGTRVCELLPSDKYNNSDKVFISQRFHHYRIQTPCSKGPCQNNGTCVAQYKKNSYVCVCKNGFEGKDCETGVKWRSSILRDNVFYQSHLNQFLTPAVGSHPQWLLCYRASFHDWHVHTFHNNCDGKRNTVTIVEAGQYVFGGYTDIPWESSGGWTSTPNAFLFSLHNTEGLAPFKSVVKMPNKAMYRCSSCGPMFGPGPDIYIADNAAINSNSEANFGYNNGYSVPSGVQNKETLLAGSHLFTPDEWEVFYLG
ncbi:hypothetical protein AWC38_SpisGene21565, partial [Stylophora pistillata]